MQRTGAWAGIQASEYNIVIRYLAVTWIISSLLLHHTSNNYKTVICTSNWLSTHTHLSIINIWSHNEEYEMRFIHCGITERGFALRCYWDLKWSQKNIYSLTSPGSLIHLNWYFWNKDYQRSFCSFPLCWTHKKMPLAMAKMPQLSTHHIKFNNS